MIVRRNQAVGMLKSIFYLHSVRLFLGFFFIPMSRSAGRFLQENIGKTYGKWKQCSNRIVSGFSLGNSDHFKFFFFVQQMNFPQLFFYSLLFICLILLFSSMCILNLLSLLRTMNVFVLKFSTLVLSQMRSITNQSF